jgi:PRTRC genetic system protein E
MFTEISNLLKDGEILRINIIKTGESMVVTVLPQSKEVKDPAAEQLIPLNLKGSPQELDEGFVNAVSKPVLQSTTLMTNMAEYEKSAEKAAKESKAVKDRQEAINKHVKEAETFEKAGKFREAATAYTKALELDKANTKIQLKINALKLKLSGSADIFSTTPVEDHEDSVYPDDTDDEEPFN